MIKFEHAKGNLREAAFGGSLSDICADLCIEVSLIYGALSRKNKVDGERFRHMLLMSFIHPDIAKTVFSTDAYDAIAGNAESYTVEVGEEFDKQLKEMMGS